MQRESRAAFTSNDGFSVVAPIRMMLPFSTKGRKASCCALLKRWISSTNTMVRSPKRRFCSACSMTARISRMPLVTALKSTKADFVRLAMMRASVVFPTPGGPQKIREGTRSPSMRRRSTFPSPRSCSWPANSSSVRGRMRLASGSEALPVPSKSPICSKKIPPFPFPRPGRGARRPAPAGRADENHAVLSITQAAAGNKRGRCFPQMRAFAGKSLENRCAALYNKGCKARGCRICTRALLTRNLGPRAERHRPGKRPDIHNVKECLP